MIQSILRKYYLGVILLLFSHCSPSERPEQDIRKEKETHTFFQLLDSSETGVNFNNQVTDGPAFNILTYRNFYNGGGVAIGDINNDSLPDLYFSANQLSNRLYLNRGNFQFEDITEKAGVAGTKPWSTGVAMADVNGDGWLDIYVCNSGDTQGAEKENELFINNQDGTFSERAAEFGLNNTGYSTQAVFFDYDQDNDLDCYLLNNSFKEPGRIELFTSMRERPDELGGDKLYRNEGNTFTDVTREAGIYSSQIGFGLGAAIGDVNQDNLPDLYVSNDFWERDYLYINQGDGTFSEELIERLNLTSLASMGGDIADINNDGFPEIFSTDMLPGDNHRLHTMTTFDPYHLENMKYRANYHYQFIQNCLHLNTGQGNFQEVSFLSGVAATDWSWGALVFDFENDGKKDLFVSNGIARDITSADFRDFLANQGISQEIAGKNPAQFKDFISQMPSKPIPNYAFSNINGLTFKDKADELGLDMASFSNGSAYGDLDNDGDWDLVVNNVNMPGFIYRNEANSRLSNHFLKIRFQGQPQNPFGLGAKVKIRVGKDIQVMENYNARGFQSSVESNLIFGLGKANTVDRLEVSWSDGKKQELSNLPADQVLVLTYSEAKDGGGEESPQNSTLFQEVSQNRLVGNSTHKENPYNDFDHEPLLNHMLSTEGPRLLTGDVNGDQREDVIVLGANGDEDKLFIQTPEGTLRRKRSQAFQVSAMFESTCGALFDQDLDGDLDLMLGSGGNEYQRGNELFILRYYRNNGDGNFVIDNSSIPQVLGNFSCMEMADIDQDGDMDMFLGARTVPGNYGLPPRSFLLRNEGESWLDITPEELSAPGMVTDATWADMDQDGDQDLILVGEWMPIKVFLNEGGILGPLQELPNSAGWWTRIEAADLDQDGDTDFVLGNWGLNSKFKASISRPLQLFVNDFDQNEKSEFIYAWYPPLDNRPKLFAPKQELTQQLPSLKKDLLSYEAYANATYESLFEPEMRRNTVKYTANTLESAILWNESGQLARSPLPLEAQVSPIFGISIFDFSGDNIPDIWLGGNFYGVKPQAGRYDASRGTLLKGSNGRSYEAVPQSILGPELEGEVRDAGIVQLGQEKVLLISRNNRELVLWEW